MQNVKMFDYLEICENLEKKFSYDVIVDYFYDYIPGNDCAFRWYMGGAESEIGMAVEEYLLENGATVDDEEVYIWVCW